MTMAHNRSNKAKIARRVIEVLEFFDDAHPEATVMDIVRRYDRPQSSTSELLSSLVDLGILHKDAQARVYRPTVRAAMLGVTTQDEMVRDGRLSRFMDRLVSQTGLRVSLFARSGLDAQIILSRQSGKPAGDCADMFRGGEREMLTRSAAGWLLLSTLEDKALCGTLRRINADAQDHECFNHTEMRATIARAAAENYAYGPAGFGSEARMVSVLLPSRTQEHALAVGIVISHEHAQSRENLARAIADASRDCLIAPASPMVERLQTAA